MIEINQVLTNNVEYLYSITEIPEINTDSAYIYDVSCTGIPTVTKVDQTTFKMFFNTESAEFNTTVKLKINGIYGYDDWSSNMVGNENTLQIQVKFNITRGISPFVLQNTSNSAKTITLDYDAAHATEDFDMYACIDAIESSYSHYTWEHSTSNKQFSFTIPAHQNLYLYSLSMTSMGRTTVSSPCIGAATLNSTYNIVKFGGNFTGITFGGNIYALTNNNTSSVALFYGLFEGCNITTAPALPATQIGEIAYAQMFKNCTSLTTAPPALPATSGPHWCYASMFSGCTSLTTGPSRISATWLEMYTCTNMFKGCTSLTSAPALSFTSVWPHSCHSMFEGCTSLTTMPKINLSNTTSARDGIYYFDSMFKGCTSLTTLTTLDCLYVGSSGYANMFMGCTSLTTIPNNMLPADHIDSKCYSHMFDGCTSLTTIPSNLLSAVTNLRNDSECYLCMFMGCTSLTTIPSHFLPATTLSNSCYQGMFSGCTSLTTIPSNLLPTSTLKYNCYYAMFYGCTSLTTIPNGLLNGSTLAEGCYQNMFMNCTSLRNVPQYLLSAETCKTNCYTAMFSGCTSLVTPPELRATQIETECYKEMFKNCSNLTSVYCRATTSFRQTEISRHAEYSQTTTWTNQGYVYYGQDKDPLTGQTRYIYVLYEYDIDNCFKDWLTGVAASGTASVKNNGMMRQLPTNSGSGIPSGWSRVYI